MVVLEYRGGLCDLGRITSPPWVSGPPESIRVPQDYCEGAGADLPQAPRVQPWSQLPNSAVGVVSPGLEMEKLKCTEVELGPTAGTRTGPPFPPPTHRPLPALGAHVTEDRHGHAGA